MNYMVWCPERAQSIADAKDISAADHAHAAMLWADIEDFRSAEFLIANGDMPVLHVQQQGDPEVRKYRIRCQTTREYFAADA